MLWDIDKTKKLVAAFTEATMHGPHEAKLLNRLADMDLDGDGFIIHARPAPAPRAAQAHACRRSGGRSG